MSAQQDVDVAAPVPSEQAPVAGVNPPQAGEPGRDPQSGLDRRRAGAWYAAVAGYAAPLAVFSVHAARARGLWLARCARAVGRAVSAVPAGVRGLPRAVGVPAPPVLALFCVALACLSAGPTARGAAPRAAGLRGLVSPHRIRPSRPAGAALAIGVARALKNPPRPARPALPALVPAPAADRGACPLAARP